MAKTPGPGLDRVDAWAWDTCHCLTGTNVSNLCPHLHPEAGFAIDVVKNRPGTMVPEDDIVVSFGDLTWVRACTMLHHNSFVLQHGLKNANTV